MGRFTQVSGGRDDGNLGVMIASPGRIMWPHFSSSVEFRDGLRDPMERWSARILAGIAKEFDARLVLPFDRPFPPFQTWTAQAAGLRCSPLGLLIHPDYGLWFGLRGALFFGADVENLYVDKVNQQEDVYSEICQKCDEKPCLSHCPVDSFSDGNLNYSRCISHLKSKNLPNCLEQGCAARAACPVGRQHQYRSEQLQFHMMAFAKI